MRAQLAVFTALLLVAVFVRPAPRQARDWAFTKVAPSGVVLDQPQDAARPARGANAHGSAPSITIDVFPNLSAPGNEPQPQSPSRPGAPIPAPTIRAPAEHSPATPSPPKFSPRLQPPNGKTDGKIYPA